MKLLDRGLSLRFRTHLDKTESPGTAASAPEPRDYGRSDGPLAGKKFAQQFLGPGVGKIPHVQFPPGRLWSDFIRTRFRRGVCDGHWRYGGVGGPGGFDRGSRLNFLE